MACWPANIVGAFFLALLIFDMIYKKWEDMLGHGILGLVLTGLFWGICAGIGESVSGGILLVPVVFLVVFLATAWFIGKNTDPKIICPPEDDGCKKKAKVKAILVPRTDNCPPPFPKKVEPPKPVDTPEAPPKTNSCPPGLKATTIT